METQSIGMINIRTLIRKQYRVKKEDEIWKTPSLMHR